MPDNDLIDEDFDNEVVEEQTRNPARQYQRDLEKKNSRLQDEVDAAKASAAEALSIKKENAFLKAGITDLDKGVAKLFFKSYEGEMTPEAIKAAASAEGLDLIPTSERPEIAQELNDLASTSAIASSGAGSTPPNEIQAIRSAKTPQEVIALAQKAGSSISNEQPFGHTEL